VLTFEYCTPDEMDVQRPWRPVGGYDTKALSKAQSAFSCFYYTVEIWYVVPGLA
jgi:hypothetical protein